VTVLGASLTAPAPPPWLNSLAGSGYLNLNAPTRAAYPGAIARLTRWLREQQVDVLQTHLFDAGLVGLTAARLARTPLAILTRHHTDEMFIAGTRFHVAGDRLMTRMADRIVGLSHAVRNHMVTREGAPADKIDVIYQGFDFAALAATDEDRRRVRAELGLDGFFVIGCVARFFKTKGHTYLLRAARELVADIPNLRVLLLGGGDRGGIEQMVRENGLEDRVIFAGYRNDVPACMRAMDAVVHPSLTEAFCQTVIEALAAGCPLVVTDVAAASEVVTDGVTGLLVPPADPGALATAVRRIHANPGEARRMASAGYRSVTERFTIERMVAGQLACYRRWLPVGATARASAA
jgi:glycosyltransferase involved in cell wall biosynthesis